MTFDALYFLEIVCFKLLVSLEFFIKIFIGCKGLLFCSENLIRDLDAIKIV